MSSDNGEIRSRSRLYQYEAFGPSGPGLGLSTRNNFCFFPFYFSDHPPPLPGGFPIYYVPSSRAVCKRTPSKKHLTNPSRGVLLHRVPDEGTQ